jgi:uncharacterized protein (DUF427 family)
MTELPPENVQNYPRPPTLERVPQRIEVVLGDVSIVATDLAWRVLETHHAPTYYIPKEQVTADLRPVGGSSLCEWKGRARYFDLVAPGRVASRAAWSYEDPCDGFEAISGCVAIYASLVDRCRVGGVDVIPQPGDFYGGWVTPNLTGQIKGAPGTLHW